MPKPSTPICPRCNESEKAPNCSYCQMCWADYQRAWKLKNREKARATLKASRARRKGMITSLRTDKTCWICRETKPLDEFHRNSGSRDGRQSVCRACAIKRAAEWAKANPEKFAQNQRRYTMKRRYGLTPEQSAEMLAAQHGRCAICKRKPKPGQRDLVIDHDHKSGAVRALLCHKCNSALGLLMDNPDLMRAAAEYVERHRLSLPA